jgi:hypothetical protein
VGRPVAAELLIETDDEDVVVATVPVLVLAEVVPVTDEEDDDTELPTLYISRRFPAPQYS